MAAPQILQFEWKGISLTVPITHDLYMQIEDRVSFARLSNCFTNAGNGQVDVPLSHVAYVVFCCLRSAGQQVRSPSDCMIEVTQGEVDWGPLCMTLIKGYYGATPKAVTEERIKKKPAKSATTSRTRTRRST